MMVNLTRSLDRWHDFTAEIADGISQEPIDGCCVQISKVQASLASIRRNSAYLTAKQHPSMGFSILPIVHTDGITNQTKQSEVPQERAPAAMVGEFQSQRGNVPDCLINRSMPSQRGSYKSGIAVMTGWLQRLNLNGKRRIFIYPVGKACQSFLVSPKAKHQLNTNPIRKN